MPAPSSAAQLARQAIARRRERAREFFAGDPRRRREAEADLDRLARQMGVAPDPAPLGPRVSLVADHPDALDATLRHARTGREFTVRGLLDRQRERGLLTHAWVRDHGASLALDVRRGLAAQAGSQGVLASGPRASLRPGRLGICQALAPTDTSEAGASTYGSWSQQLLDVAAMGRLSLRRAVGVDLYWHVLFPDATFVGLPIATPVDIQASLADPARTSAFVAAVDLAWILGLYLSPALFTDGGGGAVNEGGSGKQWPKTGVSYADLHVGMPAWQQSVMAESGEGFVDYYWSVDAWLSKWQYRQSGPVQDVYQQYALNAFATDPTTYMAECARRKCLGLAAFADGIGRVLASIDTALRSEFGDRVTDVIPVLELGNELNVFFDQSNEAANEAGRMLAHMAAPVRLWVPEMRFRVPELAAWPFASGDNTFGAARWLARVVEFMDTELERWRGFDAMRSGRAAATPDFVRWNDTVAEPGAFEWPPLATRREEVLALSVTDLAHEVGFHWFHAWNDNGGSLPAAYSPEATLIDDLGILRDAFADSGADVLLCMCAGGFPARSLDASYAGVLQYRGTNETFAASMAVRILLSAVAGGCAHAMLFTYMSDIASPFNPGSWLSQGYLAMGIREDTGDPDTFRAEVDAWRRASWYAVQRLAELLDVADVRPLVAHADGLMLLRLQASGTFLLHAGTARYGYVAWVDQAAASESATFTLVGREADGVVVESLVPKVRRPLVATSGVGYPAGETVDWTWVDLAAFPPGRRWDGHLSIGDRVVLGERRVDVRVQRADPDRWPGLAILFTDMDLEAA